MSDSPAVASAQQALAGEHAAVYGYGVVGARMTGDDRARARRGLATHRAARDALVRLVVAQGAEPVAAEAAYVVAVDGVGPSGLRGILSSIEDRLCVLYADAVLRSAEPPGDADLRRFAIERMRATAVASTGWSGRAATFPGLDAR